MSAQSTWKKSTASMLAAWVRRNCRQLVSVRHPMDPIKLATTQRLGDVLARHDNVLAVLVGHAHTTATTTFAGVPVLVGGGLISTVTTDAEDMPSIDYTQPPTIALHLVQDDRLVTHWRVV